MLRAMRYVIRGYVSYNARGISHVAFALRPELYSKQNSNFAT